MSLQKRRIQKGLEAHSQTCVANLNQKLGTSFSYEVDWSCLPEDITRWNWEQPDLESLLYHSYYRPIEEGLQELFEDEMYKEAILEQVKGFRVSAGGDIADFELADGVVAIQHTMGVNQRDGGGFFSSVVKKFKNTLLKNLS